MGQEADFKAVQGRARCQLLSQIILITKETSFLSTKRKGEENRKHCPATSTLVLHLLLFTH